jgi:hypothetical protein
MKIGLVQSGARPPFPLVMHLHAMLMGSFLLLLLTQTVLMATGRRQYHMQLGLLAFVLAPALVIVGFILAPTMYYEVWDALQTAAPAAREQLQAELLRKENILLLQTRIGILFPLFLAIGFRARAGNAGMHKRMMILAVAPALAAGIDRITWLPTTMPASNIGADLWVLFAVSPLLVWDVVRNKRVHEAYWIWLAISLPFALFILAAWDTPWWHATAKAIMRVG